MIRRDLESHLLDVATRHPVVTLTGPRQSGKTTLSRQVFSSKPYVSLQLTPCSLISSRMRALVKTYRCVENDVNSPGYSVARLGLGYPCGGQKKKQGEPDE